VDKVVRDAVGKNKTQLLQFLVVNNNFTVQGEDDIVWDTECCTNQSFKFAESMSKASFANGTSQNEYKFKTENQGSIPDSKSAIHNHITWSLATGFNPDVTNDHCHVSTASEPNIFVEDSMASKAIHAKFKEKELAEVCTTSNVLNPHRLEIVRAKVATFTVVRQSMGFAQFDNKETVYIHKSLLKFNINNAKLTDLFIVGNRVYIDAYHTDSAVRCKWRATALWREQNMVSKTDFNIKENCPIVFETPEISNKSVTSCTTSPCALFNSANKCEKNGAHDKSLEHYTMGLKSVAEKINSNPIKYCNSDNKWLGSQVDISISTTSNNVDLVYIPEDTTNHSPANEILYIPPMTSSISFTDDSSFVENIILEESGAKKHLWGDEGFNTFEVIDSSRVSMDNVDVLMDNVDMSMDNVDKLIDNVDVSKDNVDMSMNNVDMSMDNVDVSMNNVDVSMNNVDVSMNNVDMSMNNVDKSMNNVDMSMNNVDVSMNNVDMSMNNVDMSMNYVDMSMNNVDMSMNNVDVSMNNVDMSMNNVDMPMNNVDVSMNNVDVSMNNVDVSMNNVTLLIDNVDVSMDNVDVLMDNVDVSMDNVHVSMDNVDGETSCGSLSLINELDDDLYLSMNSSELEDFEECVTIQEVVQSANNNSSSNDHSCQSPFNSLRSDTDELMTQDTHTDEEEQYYECMRQSY